jgi:hypothetical protein
VLLILGPALNLGLLDLSDLPGVTLPAVPILAAMALVGLLGAALWRVPGRIVATAFVAPLTLLALHALAAPILALTHDPGTIGRLLAPHQKAGLAIQDGTYHGQFGFAGRLTAPVDVLPSAGDVDAWAADHPGGLIVAPREIEGASLPVLARVPFRGGVFTIYQVPKETS